MIVSGPNSSPGRDTLLRSWARHLTLTVRHCESVSPPSETHTGDRGGGINRFNGLTTHPGSSRNRLVVQEPG